MKKFLTVTRFVIDIAIGLHLWVIGLLAALEDRAVARAIRNTDTANVAVFSAQQSITQARAHRTEAKAVEAKVKANRNIAVTAFRAEADRYRREHRIA